MHRHFGFYSPKALLLEYFYILKAKMHLHCQYDSDLYYKQST
jgi:hypothetical protein